MARSPNHTLTIYLFYIILFIYLQSYDNWIVVYLIINLPYRICNKKIISQLIGQMI
jgi:hypothetical protein